MKQIKRNRIILLSAALVVVLFIFLYACQQSDQQERQIVNVFTPGSATQQPTADSQQTQSQDDTEAANLPNEQPTMLITTTQGLPVIITATQALPLVATQRGTAQPAQPVNTATSAAYPVNTSAPTQPNQPTSPNPATNTPSPTPQTGWAGEWMVHLEIAEGAYQTGIVSLEVIGNLLAGSGSIEGQNCTFDGYVYEDNQAEGYFTCQSLTKYFRWTMLTSRQFGGSSDDRFGFCGNRQGAEKPEPCRILPER